MAPWKKRSSKKPPPKESSQSARSGWQPHALLLVWKLEAQQGVYAIILAYLLHLKDGLSKQHYLVDTGAACAVVAYNPSADKGPSLFGLFGEPIKC